GADMVLVRMREHDGREPVLLPFKAGEIRQDYVHARGGVVSERYAEIHHDPLARPPVEGHVHAHLAEAAEGHEEHLIVPRDGKRHGLSLLAHPVLRRCTSRSPRNVRSLSILSMMGVAPANRVANPPVA